MPDLVGHNLGPYRIVEQIGIGGMATVYKAYQPALERYVAIKVLPTYYAHDPGFAERFVREAKAVAKLTHPHVLPIYDFGQENGLSYIVMQYVDAGTLKDVLGQPVSLAMAADIIEQIADALDYAHEQGVIHRDVKPSNVLMGRRRWILLTDFGLAKMIEESGQLTGSGVGVGTPAYMAPEQGQGLKIDRRADIYSLGIILYEMVTGRVPFEAETPVAIVVKHITEPLTLPTNIIPDLPQSVERVIMKALAKNPADRYETAGKLAKALRKAVAGLDTAVAEAIPHPPMAVGEAVGTQTVLEGEVATQVVPPPASAPVPRARGLPIWAVAAIGGLLLLLLAGGLLLTRVPTSSEPLPPEAAPPRAAAPVIEDALAFMEQNPPIFEDRFHNPDSGWPVLSDGHGQRGYEEGSYLVRVPDVAGGENIAGIPLPLDRPLADFILQFDLVATEGGPGANWVIEFRAQPKARLFAGLSIEPRGFGIGLFDSGEETTLVRGPVPNYKPDNVTQVMLVSAGPNIAFFLEGDQVGVAHTDLTQPGRLYFAAINNGDPMVAYRVDNVVVWDLSPSGRPPEISRELSPIFEDFEDGRADGWGLGPGWGVMQEEDGNHALQAERHSLAVYKEHRWGDVSLRFRVKPLDGDLLLSFRADPDDPTRTRYMAHFTPEAILLHKFQAGRGLVGAEGPIAYGPDQWHQVELSAYGGHIEILVDGQMALVYDDPEPLPPGFLAFENGDPPARHLIDEVVIEPARP